VSGESAIDYTSLPSIVLIWLILVYLAFR